MIEKLQNWRGVLTGVHPDVIPNEASPFGANAVITHYGAGAGAVRRRKGAVEDGVLNDDPAVLGIFDYSSPDGKRYLLVVADDGSISIPRLPYTFTWDLPSTLNANTLLSAVTHLNATASIPGTFVYDPPAGTLITAGLFTVRCTFTPDDTANYSVKIATEVAFASLPD